MTERNDITDVPGVRVGHADDRAILSGVTVLVFERPAVAAVAIHGGAPGARDTALLAPDMTVGAIDAVVLSGGSAFGLDAAGGVQAVLAEQGRGFQVGGVVVPIVPQAIIFDLLNGGDKSWGRRSPYYELGLRAADAASGDPVALGSVGAGLGATTADLKGGVGSASTMLATGHTIGALAVVNALGSGLIGTGAEFWAAPYERNAEFGGRGWPPLPWPDEALALRTKGATPATTIACVATDATLTKAEAHRVAVMAHDGLTRALRPVHAALDGDTVFAAATGQRPDPVDPALLTRIGSAAADCLTRAIARGLFAATNPGRPYQGPPAWHDLYAADPRRKTTA